MIMHEHGESLITQANKPNKMAYPRKLYSLDSTIIHGLNKEHEI